MLKTSKVSMIQNSVNSELKAVKNRKNLIYLAVENILNFLNLKSAEICLSYC